MSSLTVPAYAKLNLTLDVLGKRPDGYHDLRMVMQSIALADELTVAVGPGRGITMRTDLAFLPCDGRNLAAAAAKQFLERTGQSLAVEIDLRKRIPVCAGMGGGSSDAAAVLRALNGLTAAGLSPGELAGIGESVGSDVPYCVLGGTALAEGRGDLLTDLRPLPDCRLVICKPDFDLPTGPMFARLRFDGDRVRPDVDGMAAALERGELTEAASRVGNVFETVLERTERQEIEFIKEILCRHGALAAAMSGSGPAVFGLFAPDAETAGAAEALRCRYAQVFEARPVGRLL